MRVERTFAWEADRVDTGFVVLAALCEIVVPGPPTSIEAHEHLLSQRTDAVAIGQHTFAA